MNTKHTPGPWYVTGKGLSRYVEGCVRPGVLQEVAWCGATEVSEQMEANARLIAAAPELLQELKKRADNAEQSAFEEWLRRTTPSGDAESVHSQWKESIDFQDYADEWRHALDAIDKATGAGHVHDQ